MLRPKRALALLLLALAGCDGQTASGSSDASTTRDAGRVQRDAEPPAGTDAGPLDLPDASAETGSDGGGLAPAAASALMSGAVRARSTRYEVIMSTGQSPGGNTAAASRNHRFTGGLVGATQGR